MTVKVIPVRVLRGNVGDCTNGGISSNNDVLYVVCPDGYINIDLDETREPVVQVVKRTILGRDIYHVEPVKKVPSGHVGWMAGGNYCTSCDSRFTELVDGMYGAVAIHDRSESQEMY